MNPLILALLVIFALHEPSYAETKKQQSGFDKFLKSLFQPRTKKATQKRTRKKHVEKLKPKSGHEPKTEEGIPVNTGWMARYWELEAAWDYPIPEDKLIKWKDGKYIVPFLVFKHYEDMANTPRRASAALGP